MLIILAMLLIVVIWMLSSIHNDKHPHGKCSGFWCPESKGSKSLWPNGHLYANCDAAWFRAVYGVLYYKREMIIRLYCHSSIFG